MKKLLREKFVVSTTSVLPSQCPLSKGGRAVEGAKG
jgi:hypothetical protein